MLKKRSKAQSFTMLLDTDTRRDLQELTNTSRTTKTTVGVIRGVVMRYAQLVRQVQTAEAAGGSVYLIFVSPDGRESRQPLDLRI